MPLKSTPFFALSGPTTSCLQPQRSAAYWRMTATRSRFLRDNLEIQTHVIDSAFRNKVTKLAFLGSSCIYPRLASQPISEDSLMTGPLESTNEWYAIAKIAGIRLCQAYSKQHQFNAISLMPTNLYGPGDNFDLDSSHVLPALIRKFHEAKEIGADRVTVWGSGRSRGASFSMSTISPTPFVS